ncbi:MAG: hypothetical protein KatS3mg032_1849 [Cyclobacteriaceae bacterium]|nr:MAG: hypothetical protein KatS3mg032_1849 [Cyclobacteriaceae bacterium]
MPENSVRTCLECGEKLAGRADKKFCSDACRIAYNNRLNSDDTSYMRSVNTILRRNRRILQGLNPTGKTRVSREKLLEKGFDFSYFTSQYKTREGAVYHYCYDQGYLELDNHQYLLVVKKEVL